MGLPNGIYRTKNGSEMEISGQHSGISEVDFDWLEEGACCDCIPEPYEQDGRMVWHCDECGGGSAELFQVAPNAKGVGLAGIIGESHTTDGLGAVVSAPTFGERK